MFSEIHKAKVLVSRVAIESDKEKILDLYREVSKKIGGIARTEEEITLSYVEDFMTKSAHDGIELVIVNPFNKNKLLAEIHCYKLTPKVFHHTLSELTIVVDPSFQKMGIGEQIFTSLLYIVSTEMSDILRIELIARESNTRAIRFYKKLGFKIEGKFEKRIRDNSGMLEADIPMAWFNQNFKPISEKRKE